MKTDVLDLWGEEIFVDDHVSVGSDRFVVRYGNYEYLGIGRMGLYLEQHAMLNPKSFPLSSNKILVKLMPDGAVYYKKRNALQ